MKFTVALLQIAPACADRDSNLEKGIRYCTEAKSRGADLAVFPEMWNTGFATCPLDPSGRKEWEAGAIDRDSVFFQGYVDAAVELDLNIAITYLERHGVNPRNSLSIISRNGDVVLDCSKVFICAFGSEEEASGANESTVEIGCDYNCEAGDTFRVCTLAGDAGKLTVGAMICADREFPE